jgi:hypothetical protein
LYFVRHTVTKLSVSLAVFVRRFAGVNKETRSRQLVALVAVVAVVALAGAEPGWVVLLASLRRDTTM